MKTSHLLLAMAVFVVGVFGLALLVPNPEADDQAPAPAQGSAGTPRPTVSASATSPPPAYDVAHLLSPTRKYLGVALHGVPQDMSRVDTYAARVGARPNIITIYEGFADGFAAAEVRKVYRYGALPIIRWEPYSVRLADIAKGRHDAYITEFATAVRTLNLPIALTVAHEMNGNWYPWGTRTTRAKDFVAAWRHIHRLFARADATNVIWTWAPNVINPVPDVRLRPLYPGDAYVDWIGLDGYYTRNGQRTFDRLFQPTISEVRSFTKRPFLIVETGSEPGTMRARAISDLFTAVAKAPDVLGFVYFNQSGSGDWAFDEDQPAVAVFRAKSKNLKFGFTVR